MMTRAAYATYHLDLSGGRLPIVFSFNTSGAPRTRQSNQDYPAQPIHITSLSLALSLSLFVYLSVTLSRSHAPRALSTKAASSRRYTANCRNRDHLQTKRSLLLLHMCDSQDGEVACMRKRFAETGEVPVSWNMLPTGGRARLKRMEA